MDDLGAELVAHVFLGEDGMPQKLTKWCEKQRIRKSQKNRDSTASFERELVAQMG